MEVLAMKVLLGERVRAIVAVAAVAFSVVLINLQGGLLLGLLRKAAMLIEFGQADVWVGHRHMTTVDTTIPIPERWGHRVRGALGIERVAPYVIGLATVTLPDGRAEYVTVVGSEPASLLGNAWVMAEGRPEAIRQTDGILVDRHERHSVGGCRLGDVIEVNGRRARIVGFTEGIVGFTTLPFVFTNLEAARHRYAAGALLPGYCSYLLVKARPGQDLDELCARIRRRLPEAAVLDKGAYIRKTMLFWFTRTGMGISFGLATLLGLLVGLGTLAQTLYGAVNERVREFATLEALGCDRARIGRFLLAQALATTTVGALAGLLLSGLAVAALHSPRAPFYLPWWVPASAVALVTTVGFLASWLPYRRIRQIDPAVVLRG